ncbi:hypothetical protein [Deinococcus sp. QL22]|uniref:hypothetical protein n=1 Tax=Deinococcus sp. QL22 TaxID=2939437 RepID=UPI002016C1AF|nr:hypothetical protein [Deinococcus sp. QL22]UQN06793.1 hypothetical protein M1R55_02395 [Deinococcus sp. QL22]
MRRGEDTVIPNWALDAIQDMTLAADIRVLLFLTRHRQYRGNTFSTKQLAIALEIDVRTVQTSTLRLASEGLILSGEGLHCSLESASRVQGIRKPLAKPLQKDSHQDQENNVQDVISESLNKGSKEERNKRKNIPPTPQGGEAQNPTAPMGEPVIDPVQVEVQTPARQKTNATDKKNVPAARRGAAALPPLPDDLAAVAGLPEAWDRWMLYRRERQLATAPSTATGMFNKLRDLASKGHPPVEVIQTSIDNGWQGLFPIRVQNLKFTPRPQTTEQANQQAADRASDIYATLQEGTHAVF